MFALWVIAGGLFGPYSLITGLNIPVQVQPQAWTLLCLIILAQIQYYDHGWSAWFSVFVMFLVGLVTAGVEVGIYFGLYLHPKEWATNLVGGMAAFFTLAALIPPYPDIWRHKRVRGISFTFLAIDMTGAVFSILSMVWQTTGFDPVGAATFLAVFFGELGMLVLHYYFAYKRYLERKKNKKHGNQMAAACSEENDLKCV